MHEEDFWSSWLREDERGKEENGKTERQEEKVKRGKEKRRKNETVMVKRRCEGCVSVEAFEIFSLEGDLERPLE